MYMPIKLTNSYLQLPSVFYSEESAEYAPNIKLVEFNDSLAEKIEFNIPPNEIASYLTGQKNIKGSQPIALNYSGHQFGHYNPTLGDGRALLLGEILTSKNKRFDIQLKGSGPTAYSRRGDGRSSLGPAIREYILSESMHALNIPTTRALALCLSGNSVQREEILPGAVLTRIASSHLRVGTFEYFYYRYDFDNLKILADYTIERLYPKLSTSENKYYDFLEAFAHKQIKLINKWRSIGFIHGVMNTDNTSIAGETIDYGPCAFMDEFQPDKVFSSIDRHGRYAYNQQSEIVIWNIACLAKCLIPFIDENQTRAVEKLQTLIGELEKAQEHDWTLCMGKKLGYKDICANKAPLIGRWFTFMEMHKLDFTNSFKDLEQSLNNLSHPFFELDGFKSFYKLWNEEADLEVMQKANPYYIPRNHLVEKAIQESLKGDYVFFRELNKVLENPFEKQKGYEDFMAPPKSHEIIHNTFCGT